MLTTILFDLDGTLLNLDLDYFLQQYFRVLASKMSTLVAPEEFVPNLIKSTKIMINNIDPGKTNMEAFMEDFTARISHDKDRIMPVFEDFYQNDFTVLQQYTHCNPMARQVVEKVMEKGYDVAIATQPVFPYAAIKHRLDWAGVGDLPFKLVTSYEDCHYCKPNIAYFQEIMDKLNRTPEECLMVGNDVDDDLPAGDLGAKTYLLTDGLLNRRSRTDYKADYTGSMEDLYRFVDNLPKF